MVEQDLGEATIVYEERDGETTEMTVKNEHIAYFQDHWIVRTGEDDRGRDVVRRIPHNRVYHVERTVERFEEEVRTLRDQVQSLAEDLRSRLPGMAGDEGRGGTRPGRGEGSTGEGVVHIDVEEGEDESGGAGAGEDESGGAGAGGEDESE